MTGTKTRRWWLSICVLLLVFIEHRAFTRTPAPESGTGVIFIPPRADIERDGPPEINTRILSENIGRHVTFSVKEDAILSIYDPRLWSRFKQKASPHSGRILCGDIHQGSFVKRELERVSRALLDTSDDPDLQLESREELRERLNTLISRFSCEEGDTPLEPSELRGLFLIPSQSYYMDQDLQHRDLALLQAVFALGQPDNVSNDSQGLEGEFNPRVNKSYWYEYSLELDQFRSNYRRIPVRIDRHRYPTEFIRIDGVSLTQSQISGEPLKLYPGLHFLQLKSVRGMWHSATFEIQEDETERSLELGTEKLIPPRAEDADELLYYAMTRQLYALPDWLIDALNDWRTDAQLRKVYIAVPLDDRDRDPDSPLLIAEFTGRSLQDVPEVLRTEETYRPLTGTLIEAYRSYRHFWLSPGVGWSTIGGNGLIGLSLQAQQTLKENLSSVELLSIHHPGTIQDTVSTLQSLFVGIQWAPTQPGISGIGGVLVGLVVPGMEPETENAQARLLALLAAQVRGGIEIPLRPNLMDGKGARYRRVAAVRPQLILTLIDGMDQLQLPEMPRTAWMLEAQLQVHWWFRDTSH